MLRLDPPKNKHAEARDQIVSDATAHLRSHALVGYHCARLHQDDINEMKSSGMQLLSSSHLQARIQRRVNAGDIPIAIAHQLSAHHSAGDVGRGGMIWFLNSRSLLRDEFGLYRLFRSWGGEALYNSHEADITIGPLLRAIGTPCIVVASLPIDQISTFMDIGERFYASFARSQVPRPRMVQIWKDTSLYRCLPRT